MNKTVYKYTDDSWVDGHEDCPCCSGLEFECYNAVDWNQNGSSMSLFNLYVDAIVAHKAEEYDEDYIEMSNWSYALYEGLTLQELKDLCERLDIVLEEVEGE